MLQSLTIQNVVLIDQLTLDFAAGFCVLSGETGAGKSILLDALGLALGERSQASLVRQGAEKASVTADFSLPLHHPVLDILTELDIDRTDQLMLRRVLYADGRSKAFINDQAVSIQALRRVGVELVEIHGQFDQMLSAKSHLAFVDAYGQLFELQSQVASAFQGYQSALQELEALQLLHHQKQARLQELEMLCQDFAELAPQPQEESHLLSQRQVLAHHQKLLQGLQDIVQLVGDERGLQQGVHQLNRTMSKLESFNATFLAPLVEAVERFTHDLSEVESAVQSALDHCEHPTLSLEELDDRLYALRTFARRHGLAPDALVEAYEKAQQDLRLLTNSDDQLLELTQQCDDARQAYYLLALRLSEERQKAIQHFQHQIPEELCPLKLEKVVFDIQLTPLPQDHWGPAGIDQLELLIQTNPGVPFGPLQKIASGGERSRLMLAMKVLLATKHHKTILIFDEIDSGVGGAVASAIGERMHRLGQAQQVLAITHSPQVAAYARQHYLIEKETGGESTRTHVMTLTLDQRRQEIARMLSGEAITHEAQAAADQLLKLAS